MTLREIQARPQKYAFHNMLNGCMQLFMLRKARIDASGEIWNSIKYLDVIPLVELYCLDSGGNEGSVEDILHSIFIGQ
jgi:hypothetical protein